MSSLNICLLNIHTCVYMLCTCKNGNTDTYVIHSTRKHMFICIKKKKEYIKIQTKGIHNSNNVNVQEYFCLYFVPFSEIAPSKFFSEPSLYVIYDIGRQCANVTS